MRIGDLDLRLRREPEHRAIEQRPAQEFAAAHDIGEMVDLAQAALGARAPCDGSKSSRHFGSSGADEIDEAALDPGDRGQRRLARSDLADIALALERGSRARAPCRSKSTLSASAQIEGPCSSEKEWAKPSRSRLTTRLISPWAKRSTSFERWRPASRKPRPSISATSSFASASLDREFDEFGALDDRRRRKRRQVGERRVAALRALRRERFARGAQRAHAVDRDRRGRGAAELVVEDFERQRARDSRSASRRRDNRRSDSRPGRDSSGNAGSATAGP